MASVALSGILLASRATGAPGASTAPKAAGLAPLAASAWDYQKARHLLSRAGFGGTTREIEKLLAMGLNGAVDHLVDFQSLPEPELSVVQSEPNPGRKVFENKDGKKYSQLTEPERRKLQSEARRLEFQQLDQVRNNWVRRMVLTQRPLEEKLTVFWHGLFACGYKTVRNSYAMDQQNQLLRKHAAGNYGQLLHGIAMNPAMLRYLDNDKNLKGRPNENLAREIMELFSMGEGQGYTEQDIKEGARALTGNAYDKQWQFVFNVKNHDMGEKTIFGQTGKFNGKDFVDLILKQNAPARFIARRLFVYFAHENPSQEIINALAGILRDNNYELRPMLKALFLSSEFYSAKAMGTQIKSPVQLVVGTMRLLEIRQPNERILAESMARMEQSLFDPPNVKGWDGGKAWINTDTLLTRYNFAGLLERNGASFGAYKDKSFRGSSKKNAQSRSNPLADLVAAYKGRDLNSAQQVVDFMAKSYLVTDLEAKDRTRMIEFLNSGSPLPPSAQWESQLAAVNEKLTAALVHLMGTPAYQVN